MSVVWITGNSGAGKTTLAKEMRMDGEIILDGDDLRAIWPGLGFDRESRFEQNLRAARLAKNLSDQGFKVIVATICPYRSLREMVQAITGCRFIFIPGGKVGENYPYEE
jgi:adenylylsulfate kinase